MLQSMAERLSIHVSRFDTSDKVWIVQNGKYLTYPKIDREQTWNFSLILSVFDLKCKTLDQNATINGREIINTCVKV